MSARAKPTHEWTDESCHLNNAQMRAAGFGSTYEMMKHYYDCSPGETKHAILHKSVRAMKCVLGRIGRMLRKPVKPVHANSGLFDRKRDSHLYQIVLAFLYGKKCLKNAFIKLEDAQLERIIDIYTNLVNNRFNEEPESEGIRNLKPMDEEGPEGVYHQLHNGIFSIDHLIEHLKNNFPIKPGKYGKDPVLNEIIQSMDRLVSNPGNTSADKRITGQMLYDAFESVTRAFGEFRPITHEVLTYKDEEPWPNAAGGVGSGAPVKASVEEVAAGGAGTGAPVKASVEEVAAGGAGRAPPEHKTSVVLARKKKKPPKNENNEALISALASAAAEAPAAEAPAAAAPAPAAPAVEDRLIDAIVIEIITDVLRVLNLTIINASSLPKDKTTKKPIVHYEIEIVADPELKLSLKMKKMVLSSSTYIYFVFHGLANSYYYSSMNKIPKGGQLIHPIQGETGDFAMYQIEALRAVANKHKHLHKGGRITKKRSRRNNATRKCRKF